MLELRIPNICWMDCLLFLYDSESSIDYYPYPVGRERL